MTSPTNVGAHSYRPSVDGLRAVAILSVLGFHAFPTWLPGGFVGVDIFFVISGFLISGILLDDLQNGYFSIGRFYARRVRRIFPALLLVLFATLAAGYFLLWPEEYRQLARHGAGGAGFIVNFLLQQETGYFAERAESKPLLHLWSLGIEEQFYIFWPLLLWVGWKIRHHAGAAIAALLLASFAANIYFVAHDVVVDFYSPFTRFWELMAGGALAWSVRHHHLTLSPLVREIIAALGLMAIIIADFTLNRHVAFPAWAALLPVGGAVALIAAGETPRINRTLLANPAAIWVGLISYPLYLWHWPVLSYAHILSGEAPIRSVRIAVIIAVFALAAVTYYAVERPIRRVPINKRQIICLLAMMAVLGSSCLAIDLSGGWKSRFVGDEEAEHVLDSARLMRDWITAVRIGDCHLQEPADVTHKNFCIENKKPLLWLWGDSHAASLYPGLKALQGKLGFGIAQMTQSGCPPLLDVPQLAFRPNCNDVNRDVWRAMEQAKPEVIIMDAAWAHDDYPMSDDVLLARFDQTLAALKTAMPKASIIVIGPAPRWLSPLPAIYRRALTFGHTPPPARMTQHLAPHIAVLDALIRDHLGPSGVIYLSTQEKLCDADGCLTRLDNTLGSLTYIDDGHLTPATSVWLINAFAPDFQAALRADDISR